MDGALQLLIEGGYGYPVIFLLLLGCGYGVPFPEDVPLIAAGVLSAHGGLSVPVASLACGFFVLLRDLSVYALGWHFGRPLLARPWARRIVTEEAVDRYTARIQANGSRVVFFGRFIMGFRAAVFFSAGVSRVRPMTFITWDGLALMVSIPLFVWLGAAFAHKLDELGIVLHDIRLILGVVVFLVVAWFVSMAILRRVKDRLGRTA